MSFSMSVVDENELKVTLEEQVKPVPEEVRQLKEAADNNVAAIMEIDMNSLDKRREILKSIESFGMNTMKASSNKNTLLQTTLASLSKKGDEGGQVVKGLSDLQLKIKDLDPSAIDFTKKGFLGKLFNPLRAYFAKYQKADEVISDIIQSLEKGKAILKNDNTTLEIEQQSLRELTKTLHKEIQLGTLMDESIEAQLGMAEARGEDPDKVRFIKEEILFPLRQRIMDLQSAVAVNQHGIISFELAIRNNRELIRGVDRANTVTVQALRNAVTLASALYNQKVVLQKIEMLNETTNNLIAGTSKMLKEQGAEIQKQSMSANISPETLKQSFADVFSALESVSAYKREALPKMRQTIEEFRQLADTGEKAIQRLEQGSNLNA